MLDVLYTSSATHHCFFFFFFLFFVLSLTDAVVHARPVLALSAGFQSVRRDRPLHEEAGGRGDRRPFLHLAVT